MHIALLLSLMPDQAKLYLDQAKALNSLLDATVEYWWMCCNSTVLLRIIEKVNNGNWMLPLHFQICDSIFTLSVTD